MSEPVTRPAAAVVRAAVDALNRGAWGEVAELAAPDVEYDLTRTESLASGVYRGRDELVRVAREFLEPWEEVRYEVHELIEAGDQVVTPYTTRFRGRQGIEVEGHAVWVWTLSGGRFTRLCLYQDRDEALRAAGAGAA